MHVQSIAGRKPRGGNYMGTIENMLNQGWVKVCGEVRVTNTKTGENRIYENDSRLIKTEGGKTVIYRPNTGVYTAFSADEVVSAGG